MRFRGGLVVGAAVGFYVGAWAGRERYQQINRAFRKIRRSATFDTATDKAKAVVDLGVVRAKDIVEARLGHEPGPEAGAAGGRLVHTPGAVGSQPATNGDGPAGVAG